jgi:ligand-binding SRPBCC domain-containing protein
MVAEPFRKLRHEHLFSVVSDSTIQMTDNLEFESPYGLLGALVDQVILSSYLKSFLRRRAEVLKNLAEQASHKPNRIPSTS